MTDAFAQFELEGWSRVAEGYERFFAPVTGQVVEPLLDAAGVGRGSSVLDVATGPGDIAARAAARGASVVGVDIAEEVVALAGRRHPHLTFRRASADDLPYDDGTFSAVVAGFLLPHLGDHGRAAAEMTRVLAPGGRLAVSTWDVPDRTPLLGVFVSAVASSGATPPAHLPSGPPFFACSTDGALVALLGGAGLEDIRVDTVTFTHRAGSPDEVWDGVIGGTVRTSAVITGQPPHLQRRIRDAFDLAVARYATADGVALPVSAKVASGRRPRRATS